MKRELKLDQIQVKSFITTLKNPALVRGGLGLGNSKRTGHDDDPTKTSSGETEIQAGCEVATAVKC